MVRANRAELKKIKVSLKAHPHTVGPGTAVTHTHGAVIACRQTITVPVPMWH